MPNCSAHYSGYRVVKYYTTSIRFSCLKAKLKHTSYRITGEHDLFSPEICLLNLSEFVAELSSVFLVPANVFYSEVSELLR